MGIASPGVENITVTLERIAPHDIGPGASFRNRDAFTRFGNSTQIAHLVRLRGCNSRCVKVPRSHIHQVNFVERIDLRWPKQVLGLVIRRFESRQLM